MGRGPETSLLPYVILKKWIPKLIIFNNHIAVFEKRYSSPKTSVSGRRDLNVEKEKRRKYSKRKTKFITRIKNKTNNKKKNV